MSAQKDGSFTVVARRLRTNPAAWLGLLIPLLLVSYPEWISAKTAGILGLYFIAALSASFSRPTFSLGSTQIRVAPDGVEIDRRRVASDALRAVRVHSAGSSAILELDPGPLRPSRWFEVGGMTLGRDIAASIRDGDASRFRHRFQPSSIFVSSYLALLVAMLVLLCAGAFGLPYWALMLVGAVTFFGERATRSLEVGGDGVHVRGPLRSVHLEAATLKPVTTREVRSGRGGDLSHRLVFEDAKRVVSVWVDPDDVPAIQTYVEEVLAAQARHADAKPTVAELLAGRTVEELRALGERPETFRAEGVDHTTLIGVVEDPLAEPEVRARAAIALSKAEPSVRARVRVAAEQSTHPQLRVALESLDDDGAQERLDRLDRAR